MKKTSTLLTALLMSGILFAQAKLSISSTGHSDIRVMVDGRKYPTGNGMILLNDLYSGNHTVKIFQAVNDQYRSQGYSRNDRFQLVYSSTLFLKPQYHVDIVINRFGKAFVDEQLINGSYDDEDDWGVDNNDHYYDNSSNRAMDNTTFQQLKQTIEKETFQDAKSKIAKQFMAINYFTTAQVKVIVGLFFSENSKLDIAKFAYDYTVDKANYFIINDALFFSSSKEALMDYIKNRK